MSPSHRIHVTGANGYIACPAKHSVHAVVRSQAKVDSIKALFPNIPSTQLDYAVVPDITIPGAFDEALKSSPPFDIVMGTASPFLFKAANGAADFFEPAIKGTTEFEESHHHVFVRAVGAFGLIDERNNVYVEEDSNPETLEGAENAFAQENKQPAHLTTKTFAERAAWEFKEKAGAGVKWDVVTLNLPMVYGPLTHKISNLRELKESTARIYKGFLADKKPEDSLISDGTALYVDVRDIGLGHVLTMDAPRAANQRFSISAGELRSQEIFDLLPAEVQEVEHRVPMGEPGKDTKSDDAIRVDSSKEKLLGLKLRTKKDTVGDIGRQPVEIEKEVGLREVRWTELAMRLAAFESLHS